MSPSHPSPAATMARPWRPSALIALCLAAAVVGRGAEGTYVLRPQAQVSAAGVYLDQVVAGSETNAVPHIRLADAPAPGRVLQLGVAQVDAVLRGAAPAFAPAAWSGAPAVQIVRRTRILTAAEVLATLRDALQKQAVRDQGELELRFARPWSPAVIADEPCTLRISDLPPSGLTPTLQVRLELATDQESLGVWQVALEAHLMRDIWVARSELKRGDSIADSDVALERRDALRYRDLLPADTDFTRGWQAAEPLQPGQPLVRRSLQLRTVVQRGQVIDGVYREGGLTVSLKVEVIDPGVPGQVIRVRNTLSRRELRAKVLNEQAVQIQL